MLLAYVHCFGVQSPAELCLVADRPDQFSVPVRVDLLEPTECAVLRLGPVESVTVRADATDNGLVIEPFFPAKLFLTPDLPQYPGVFVKRLKVIFLGERRHRVFFQQEKDAGSGDWREWSPYRDK